MARLPALTKQKMIRGRVEAGAAYLSVVVGPKWYKRIDLSKLEMADGDCCVVGQLVEGYFIDRLGLNEPAATIFGFDSGTWRRCSIHEALDPFDTRAESYIDHDALTTAWTRKIGALQAADAVA